MQSHAAPKSDTAQNGAAPKSNTAQTGVAPLTVNGLGLLTPQAAPGHADPHAHHELPLDPRTYSRALDCVHCGLCLPACPTYTQNGLEADSPRGRIHLMKGLADDRIEPTEAVLKHLDLCLDCRACETACPSGVVYHELIEETRTRLADKRKPTWVDRFMQMMFFKVFPYPNRLKLALLPARIMQKLGLWNLMQTIAGPILPRQLQKMQQMLPSKGALIERPLAEHYPADKDALVEGKPKATVALMAGCIGSVLGQQLNRQTIRLLQKAGCDVVVPPAQGCCGAIHHHGGDEAHAQQLARNNLTAILGDSAHEPDYIVTNVAGCGATLKEYDHLLRDDKAHAEKAGTFVAKMRDINQLLVELGLPEPQHSVEKTVTYHDACHLAHAQKITDPPRVLLKSIPGLKVIALPESDMCCGAAGTYNLSQPEMARQLAARKLGHIQETGATICVSANIGCTMQIQSEANRLGVPLEVVHPVALLYEAHFGTAK